MRQRRREFPLRLDEMKMIDTLEENGLTASQIARHLQRQRRTVAYYLCHRESHCEEEDDQPALGLYGERTYGRVK